MSLSIKREPAGTSGGRSGNGHHSGGVFMHIIAHLFKFSIQGVRHVR